MAYATALWWIWESWNLEESYYAHGPLMPFVAAFMIWSWRDRWGQKSRATDMRGWLLLGPGLFMHLCGAALTIDSISAASLCLSLPGVTLLALGPGRFRVLAPVLFLPLFAVPLPMFLTGAIAFEMKEIATDSGLALARLLGSGAMRTGANISIPGQSEQLYVAAACSGLRSLVSLVTLGYCIAFFMGEQSGLRRWILLALAVPVAVISNILRIAAICGVAEIWSVEAATGVVHDVLNAGVWLIDLVILLAIDAWLTRIGSRGKT
ncbi:MAG: exosortase/archaeosortase family protein [Planctomycetota bacterium]|jgi:exosortase